MRRKNTKLKFISLSLMIFFILNIMQFSGLANHAANGQESVFTASEMATKAVNFINDKFNAGEKIDGYTAYVLALAGEDLSTEKWSRNGNNLRSEIENLTDQLGDSNSIIKYIYSTQNNDGSFGPYANEYGTKAPLQALAAIKNDLTVGSDVYNQVQNSINNTVNYFKTKYQNGSMNYSSNGWNFDYRCVEALSKSGEDLTVGGWVYNGTSLKDIVIASASSTADTIKANPSVQDAVYLAKELTALYAVNKSSDNIDILAKAIIAKQNDDGSFGTSIFDHIMVLTAIGKAGMINSIDQIKAFNYIDNLKEIHQNSWGQDAGVAWGSQYTTGFEESDTTAQVLTALSYFSDAKIEGSDVYNTIQSGLTYLNDVQDVDTAAIVRIEGDNTFSTAETLLAFKSLGKTIDQYTENDSEWVKKSRTKTITQCMLALNKWNDTTRLDRLVSLLTARQKIADPGKGSFENSIYSDMWAYIALGEAGKLDALNTGDAKMYILSKQGVDGSWGETFDQYYPDFLSTVQALRALSYLSEASATDIQTAINNGLNYLKTLQQNDGSVCAQYDDPAVDNSEMIITLHKLNKDPEGTEWTKTIDGNSVTPVSYLMNNTMNADGSFGASKNVFGATEALYAYLIQDGNGQPGNGGTGDGPTENQQCSVNIAVVGQSGELLYGPNFITITKSEKCGLTAMGALYTTGLSYTEEGGFVKSISGQAYSGMNGWMYKVNGTVPMMTASDKVVKDGDKVIWWYSTDMNSSGPSWDSLAKGTTGSASQSAEDLASNLREQNKNLPVALQLSENVLTELEKINKLLGLKEGIKEKTLESGALVEAVRNVVVVGNGQPLNLASLKSLKNELVQNAVALNQKVEFDKGATLTDPKAELALIVPAQALSRDMQITVKETTADSTSNNQSQPTVPVGFCQMSKIYDFSPDGTTFTVPMTLSLRVIIPPLVKPENLVLARYDKSVGKWLSVPAVVDLDKGLILASLQHFSQYTVFAGESLKSFVDVTPTSFGWAKDNIETLAGAGIATGIDDTHFEPSRKVTRAEFTSWLVEAFNLPTVQDATISFKDIKAGDWYEGAVKAAHEAGLVNGYEDDTFRPNSTVSREELAALLVRAMKLEATEEKLSFTDSDRINSWARSSVTTASTQGLIKGFPDGTFRPEITADRGECAAMVYRMLTEY